MTPAEVRETLLDLGNTLFPVTFESYLTAQGRPLWGLLIEPEHRRFSELFGNILDRDLRLFNTRFADTKAGFATGARSVFFGLSCNPDVFLLAKEGLGWSHRDLASVGRRPRALSLVHRLRPSGVAPGGDHGSR